MNKFKLSLPSIEEIEAELASEFGVVMSEVLGLVDLLVSVL